MGDLIARVERVLSPRLKQRAKSTLTGLLDDYFAKRFPSVTATLGYLREWGFRPQTVVDVGAYVGEWTQLLKTIFPTATVLMVEPQESKREALEAIASLYPPTVLYSDALLGGVAGEAVEFFEMETGSSVFEEQSDFPRRKTVKTTTTLDSLVRSVCGWERVDLLKLDVQGYELDVMTGASSYLSTCEFVLVEASLIPINRGCPLIVDVVEFMRERGFRMLDFCSQIRLPDGALWQVDLMFVNERSQFLPAPVLRSTRIGGS